MRKSKLSMIICSIFIIVFALGYFISIGTWHSFIIYIGGILVSISFSVALDIKCRGIKTKTRYFVDPKNRKFVVAAAPDSIVRYMSDHSFFEVSSVIEAETFIRYYEWCKKHDKLSKQCYN